MSLLLVLGAHVRTTNSGGGGNGVVVPSDSSQELDPSQPWRHVLHLDHSINDQDIQEGYELDF